MDKIKYVGVGDIIYVSPKVMSLKIVERIDKIIDAVKFALMTAASVVVFISFTGLFNSYTILLTVPGVVVPPLDSRSAGIRPNGYLE